MSHRSPLTRRCLFSLPLAAGSLAAQPSQPVAVAVATALRSLSFDPSACWRVRELEFLREDLKVYLTDGFLLLAQPVAGGPCAALFHAEVDGGDAEVIVLPPDMGERQSLAAFTGSPNLDEHFRSALFLFTDGTAAEVMAYLDERKPTPAPEMGALLSDRYSPSLRNLISSFETRLIQDIAGRVRPKSGLFFAAFSGTARGNFDAIHDPAGTDQIVLAQLQNRQDRLYYNVWTSFPSRRVRRDPSLGPALRDFVIENVSIDATLDANLRLSAATTLRIRIPAEGGSRQDVNSLAFDISRRMRVTAVSVDGTPAPLVQRETLRMTLLRGNDNESFLVACASPLAPGAHTIVFQHEGEVILPAGNNVYFVSARGNWYPQHGLQFATCSLSFRYPKHLTLVATGTPVEDRVEGEERITRCASETPLRLAGFNLGDYKKSTASRGPLTVTVYANRSVEAALSQVRRDVVLPSPSPVPSPRRPGARPPAASLPPVVIPTAPPDPSRHIDALAAEVAEAFDFFAARFGPPPLPSLAVSPIPGAFGQGFPGLIYLSTLAYLPAADRPSFASEGLQAVFFSDLLVAHEVAHQWWGNTVTTASYRDEWIMESLANYAALLLLERKRGARAVDGVLERYREHLSADGASGKPLESAGPISLGARLESSVTPDAYRAILYEKGTWIIHMIRHRLGDQAFFAMLRELHTKFLRRRLTAADLRNLAASHLPKGDPDPGLEVLFQTFVDGTGIPTLRLASRGRRLSSGAADWEVELEQTGVSDEFTLDVPIEIDYGRGRTERRWIRTDGTKTSLTWRLPSPPLRVLLDPKQTLLAARK